ncbi:MAG: hypothetical protein ABTQ32_27650 [Myxococcaceae bacterium]
MSRRTTWLLGLAFVVLAVRLGHFVDRFAVNLVFWDQWDFLQGLFDDASLWELFRRQHGPHRQGVANLLIAGEYALTGWNGRADAALAAIVMALTGLGGLWWVRRVTGSLTGWDVVVLLLFLTTTNSETYVGTPNLAHGPIPALCLVAFALACTITNVVWRCVAMCVANFFAVSGGFTFLLGAITLVVLLVMATAPQVKPGQRAVFAGGIVVAVLTMALFFHGYAFSPAVDCYQFPHPRPLDYLPFTGFVLLRPLGLEAGASAWRQGLASLGAVLVVVGGAYATWRMLRARGQSPLWNATCALVGFVVLFASTAAVGRVCQGLESASVPRYVPYVLPAALAGYGVLRSSALDPRWQRALLVIVLGLALFKELDASGETESVRVVAANKRLWRDCYLRHHDLARCDAETAPVYPMPEATQLQQKLDWLEARGYSFFQEKQRVLAQPR